MAAMRLGRARCDAGRLVGGQPRQQAARVLVAAVADDGDGVDLVGAPWRSALLRMMAARASCSARLTRASVSLAMRRLERAAARWRPCDLNTACAASKRLAGSGDEQRQAAERRLDARGAGGC